MCPFVHSATTYCICIHSNQAVLVDFYNTFFSLSLQNSIALASVTLPATLFPPDAPADCKLQFVAFRTGSFFPLSGNSSSTGEHSRRRSVNTPVIFVDLGKEVSQGQHQVTKKKDNHIVT